MQGIGNTNHTDFTDYTNHFYFLGAIRAIPVVGVPNPRWSSGP
jgi:hypothetical protein